MSPEFLCSPDRTRCGCAREERGPRFGSEKERQPAPSNETTVRALRDKLGRLPLATTAIATLVTIISLAELIAGRGPRWPDRLTVTLGLWPAHLPAEIWRLITGNLVNPAFRTETVSFSVFDHWAANMLILISAGRRVERRLGSWAVVGACVVGALGSSIYLWARFPGGGPGGGTSGASFGVLGAVLLLGLWAGGGYRRYALGALAATILILSWMYNTDGIVLHVIAIAAGAALAAVALAGWRRPQLEIQPS